MLRKILALLMVMLIAAVFVTGCGGSNTGVQGSGGQKFINIATGGTAGTYFPLGGALAEIWNKNIKGANATAQATGASVANVNLLKDGKADVIFVQNDIAYYAYTGSEMFKDKKYEDIRGLATLYPETIQIVTTADKGIKALADLKGKKVAVGAAGSGSEANARQILEAAGITYNDIQVQYLSFSEAANSLKDGNIDAAFVTAGFPTAAITDIATQHKIALIPLDDKTIETLISKYPFYSRTVIPANTYSGQTEDVTAVSVKSMLAVSAQYPEDLVYQMVKTMYENKDRLIAAHEHSGKQIVPESGKENMSIPLHPGAEKYFKEIGK
ncbi:MAG: TAXI family TRAP transporter solute-binding subunit [Thermosediminibacteraceae bacterium]|nr:TAXI family TRAP transporter solute-binding subunit [Thermosediminibacteraceae bacterium]